jgi:hypothetical protein
MKKSEVIKLINDYLVKNHATHFAGHHILKIVEDAGMMPPIRLIPTNDGLVLLKNPHEWESENEAQ